MSGRMVRDGTLSGAVNWVNTVAFSPDGRSLAGGTSGARVLVWSLATRRVTAELPHPQPVTSVTWDGTGRIAAAGADGTVSLWLLPSAVLPTGSAPTQLAYGPGGGTLAVGGSGRVELWDTYIRTLLASFPLPTKAYANATAFRPAKAGGPLLAVAVSDGTVRLLNGSTLAPVAPALPVISGPGAAESVAFSPDGRLLATGADDGSVRLFDVTSPAHPRQLTLVRGAGTTDPIYTVVFAPDGTLVAAASVNTDSVQLWRLAGDGLARAGPDLGGMASYPIGLAFTPDSRTLAIGNSDKHVYLWDVASPARPRRLGAPLTGPSGQTWTVAVSPDGKALAAGANDGTVWLWNLADPAHPALTATLSGLPGHVFSVTFSPGGTQLAAASYDDDTVRLWDTSPAAARAAICGNLGQPVSARDWATYVPGVPYLAPCSLDLGPRADRGRQNQAHLNSPEAARTGSVPSESIHSPLRRRTADPPPVQRMSPRITRLLLGRPSIRLLSSRGGGPVGDCCELPTEAGRFEPGEPTVPFAPCGRRRGFRSTGCGRRRLRPGPRSGSRP